MEARLGKYSIDSCRIDLIPSVALERLGLHNELCALKWKDPAEWQRDGEPSIGTIFIGCACDFKTGLQTLFWPKEGPESLSAAQRK